MPESGCSQQKHGSWDTTGAWGTWINTATKKNIGMNQQKHWCSPAKRHVCGAWPTKLGLASQRSGSLTKKAKILPKLWLMILLNHWSIPWNPHRSFYTQRLLHTDAFTHRRFYIQTLLHTDPFTHRRFYTQALLHTDAFTHRRFYTQTRGFYTQKLSHTEAFTHNKHFHTQTGPVKSQFYLSFWRSNLISRVTVAIDTSKSQFYHFVRKGCGGLSKIAILPQFLTSNAHFVRKGCGGLSKIAILPQFLASNVHFVRKGCAD